MVYCCKYFENETLITRENKINPHNVINIDYFRITN